MIVDLLLITTEVISSKILYNGEQCNLGCVKFASQHPNSIVAGRGESSRNLRTTILNHELLRINISHSYLHVKWLLVEVGLKDSLLEADVTRMDPISPPTEESPFMDLLAWQAYHLISKLGNIDGGDFVFG